MVKADMLYISIVLGFSLPLRCKRHLYSYWM